jgi:hypothetical protein
MIPAGVVVLGPVDNLSRRYRSAVTAAAELDRLITFLEAELPEEAFASQPETPVDVAIRLLGELKTRRAA